MAIGDELSNLNFEAMIGGPLSAVIKAQAQAAVTSVDFIKAVGFDHDDKILSATIITILIVSLVTCLVAISWQQIGVLKGAKHYFEKADKVSELIKNTKMK